MIEKTRKLRREALMLLFSMKFGFNADKPYGLSDDKFVAYKDEKEISIDVLNINSDKNGFLFNREFGKKTGVVIVNTINSMFVVNLETFKDYVKNYPLKPTRLEDDLWQVTESAYPVSGFYNFKVNVV